MSTHLLKTDEMLINMGPQHPSTHGVLRLELQTDGEVVRNAEPQIGYLHRCFEKHAENLTYPQIIPYTDRLDYIAAMNMNHGFVMAVEKLAGIEVPERAEFCRVIVAELNRIASHLLAFGTYGMDMGAFTPFLYSFRERELVLDLFEICSGARLTYNYIRIGGVMRDLHETFMKQTKEFLDLLEPKLDEYNNLLSYNHIFINRTRGIGVITPEQALSYNITGPNLRGSGISWDLRRNEPYSIYEQFDFEVPVGSDEIGIIGDSWNRYYIRLREMAESVKIIRQAIEKMPEGDTQAKVSKNLKPPAGEVYSSSEAPRGELGFYIISDGTPKPFRVKVKSPCFTVLSAVQEISKGALIADIVAIIGSIDIVLGEVDR